MPNLARCLPILLLAAVGCAKPAAAPPVAVVVPATKVTAPTVELTEVTMKGFEQAIQEQKGKVVLIDVWFLRCAPCVKKFPKIVELHKKYAADGLVVMSFDMLSDEIKDKDDVLKFLTDKGATFPNFIVNDTEANLVAWQARHDAEIPPAAVLFGRNGEHIKLAPNGPIEELEAAIQTALAKR